MTPRARQRTAVLPSDFAPAIPAASSPKIWLVLALLLLLAVAGRMHTFNEPLDRDITTYAVIGHELLAGKKLYTDLWDHKPPAIHAAFAASEWLVGYGPQEVFLLNVAAALVTLAGVFQAGRQLGGGPRSGLWAAAVWVLLSLNMDLQANQPNTEVFINACIVWIMALLLGTREVPAGWVRAVVVGLLAALASLFKQTAIVPVAFIAVVAMNRPVPATMLWKTFTSMLLAGIVAAAVWAVVAGYFAAQGRWHEFYQLVFVYNRAYAGNMRYNLAAIFQPAHFCWFLLAALPSLVWLISRGMAPGGDMVVPVTMAHLRSDPEDTWIDCMLLAAALGTALAVALPGRWFVHYYQLWSPLLAWSLARGLVLLGRMPATRRRWVPEAVAALLLLPLVIAQVQDYRLGPRLWSALQYESMAADSYDQAQEINTLLKPGETLWDFGSETAFYFVTHRSPPSAVLYELLTGNPALGQQAWQRLEQDLRARPVDLIVMDTQHAHDVFDAGPQARSTLTTWIVQNYRRIPDDIQRQSRFVLCARHDSSLAHRIWPPVAN